jgi:hypothetical protein
MASVKASTYTDVSRRESRCIQVECLYKSGITVDGTWLVNDVFGKQKWVVD